MIRSLAFLVLSALLLASCGDTSPPPPRSERAEDPAGTAPRAEAIAAPTYWSEVKLHEVIRAANPAYSGNGQFQIDEQGRVQAIALDNCGVTDLAPLQGMSLMALYLQGCAVAEISVLKGMPLVELYLEKSAVKDLSPLAGMSTLQKLYLSGTAVSDLKPLKGLGIVEMNLVETRVSDLSPLEGMPLQMLWLTDTPVRDIAPLAKSPLVSLTLHRSAVSDLKPLANTALQRLHVGETGVTDLSPLRGLRLTRLVFDPDKITKGIEVLLAMNTLTELGTKFEEGSNDLAHPAVFFQSRAQASPALAPEAAPAQAAPVK